MNFRKITVCIAGALAFCAGLRADDLAMNSATLPDNPYAPIVTRNVFGLNPPVPPAPPDVAGSVKITPSGIQDFLGQLQVLFKVSGAPGKKGDQFYILSVGQRQDDIEIVSIDRKNGYVTFKNHGEVQELPLTAPASTGGGSPPPLPVNSGGFTPPNTGDNGNNLNGRGFTRFGQRGGGFNGRGGGNGMNGNGGGLNNSGNDDSTLRTVPTRTYQPPASQLTPEETVIMIEAQREKYRQEGNPTANILPPTTMTPPANEDTGQ